MRDTFIYLSSFEDAEKYGELNEYKESLAANTDCKNAIEKAIRENFDGMYLAKNAIKQVLSEFGFDRVCFVLANTLKQKDYDGRFSRYNKEWAKTIFIPDDRNRDMFTVDSHPAVLDCFINSVRKAIKDLNLYDNSHCVPLTGLDLENKILVLNLFGIKDEYKKPEYQLFFAQSGFGCSPTASGRKVFGTFLYDGEKTNFDRSRFLGVLKPEHIPDWAKEKANALQKPSVRKQLAEIPKQKSDIKQKNIDKGAR